MIRNLRINRFIKHIPIDLLFQKCFRNDGTCTGTGHIVLGVRGFFHFKTRAVPGEFQNGVLRCDLNLGHHGTIVHIKNEDATVRSPQIHLHQHEQNDIICKHLKLRRYFATLLISELHWRFSKRLVRTFQLVIVNTIEICNMTYLLVIRCPCSRSYCCILV